MTDKTDTFTKDELERIESSPDFTLPLRHLAAFALAQMEGKEAAEAERDSLRDEYAGALGTLRAIGEAVSENGDELAVIAAVRRVVAERDEARRELKERVAERNVECDRLQRYLNLAAQERDEARRELAFVLFNANRVLCLLNEYGASIIPHLMDDDDNPGEEIRRAVLRARERGKVAP